MPPEQMNTSVPIKSISVNSGRNKKIFLLVGVMVALVMFGIVVLVLKVGLHVADSELEPKSFVTPEGVSTLRPPKGWTSKETEKPYFFGRTIVDFWPSDSVPSGPSGSYAASLEVRIAKMDTRLLSPTDYLNTSANMAFEELKEIVAKGDIKLGNASGVFIEGKTVYDHMIVYILVNKTNLYTVFGISKEELWEKYKPVFEKSFQTLEVTN